MSIAHIFCLMLQVNAQESGLVNAQEPDVVMLLQQDWVFPLINAGALEESRKILSEPYFRPSTREQLEMPLSDVAVRAVLPAGGIYCASHHKTGTLFCKNFIAKRSDLTGEGVCNHNIENCSDAPDLTVGDGNNFERYIESDPKLRMIHWVRPPLDMIVSSYRYNKDFPELWSFVKNVCLSGVVPLQPGSKTWSVAGFSRNYTYEPLDTPQCKEIFALCDENCPYQYLMRNLDEHDGVTIEALNMWRVIDEMLNTMAATADDSRVLHLSTGHLIKDFDQTMACINNFLDDKALPPEDLYVFDSLRQPEDSQHSTSHRHDNTEINEFLNAQPMWANDINAASALFDVVFQREADLYGCPMP